MQMVDLEEVVLPGNARLLYHDNECYDWGTLGWIMSAGMVDIEDYKYFIMINSSVRGPYAPPYMPVGLASAVPGCLLTDREVYVCSTGGQLSQSFIMLPVYMAPSSWTCKSTCTSGLCTLHNSICFCASAAGKTGVPQIWVSFMTAGLQAKGGIQNYIGMRREVPAWHKRLTSQFDNDTRLVGPIISCEGTSFEGNP